MSLGDSNLLRDDFLCLDLGLVVAMLTFSVSPAEEVESLSFLLEGVSC